VVSLGAQVVYRLDAVLVALFLSAEKVGLYSVALASAGVVFGAGTSVGMIFFSRFDVDAPAATRLRELRRGVRQATLLSSAVVAPMFVFMPQLVRILYGAPYADSVLASRILVLASIALCVDYLLMHAAIKMGEARAVQRVQLGVCLLSVILLSIAVATGSIVWVATVSLVCYPISVAFLLWWLRHTIAHTDEATLR
jgi:O-antigen/teichoic acid export membrane protein